MAGSRAALSERYQSAGKAPWRWGVSSKPESVGACKNVGGHSTGGASPGDTVWVAHQDAESKQADIQFRKVDVYKGKTKSTCAVVEQGPRHYRAMDFYAVEGIMRLEPSA